ncbi:MAG: EexN family lipoprotein [Nitrospira sp.]|nr:EexN family lipoprotein [Nitrospira sp.]
MTRTCSQRRVVIGWSLRPIVVGLVLSGVLGVGGCTKESLEPVQTVEWYKQHEAERLAMATKCHNNPGQLEKTPNCVNAITAVNDMVMGR